MRSRREGTELPFTREDFALELRAAAWRECVARWGLKRSKGDRHAQEPCRNGGGILTLILAAEQIFEFFLELSGPAGLLCGFEGVHGWSVVGFEYIHERRWLAGKVEGERVSQKEIFSAGTPAAPNRSMTLLSTPQVIGLTKPSGGGGV